ncbi:MAG: permease-like cell division protein FtsX [Armatimonadetes bacterium]|nr:permease-like cell division protein FtsX [Armatimonadota bacterium]
MSLRNIEFLIEEAFTGIRRNGLMAFASISTIALSLAVLGAFVLAALAANHFIATKIGEFQIAVFINPEANGVRAKMVSDRIGKMDYVKGVIMRDRDKEWAEFKRDRPDFETAGLSVNWLPYTLDVKVSDPERLPILAARIRSLEDVDAVKDGKEEYGRVVAIAQTVKAISVAGVIVLLITTAFIISNAIRLTLYARRREIRIMQLVGATNEFIRLPLVLEGMVFGAAGAFAAWVLLKLVGSYAAHSAQKIAAFLAPFSSGLDPAAFAGWMMLLGAIIGAAGSFVSIRRFLHD